MKYEWLLFDLDNTLLDFDKAALNAFQHTLSTYHIPSQPHYYKVYKKINSKVWKAYENKEISSLELRSRRFELFLKAINKEAKPIEMSKTYLALLIEHSSLLEGAKEMLDYLATNYKLAIITNGLKEVQRPRLALTKIEHYFKAIIVSDEIGVAKPQTAYFEYVFKEIQYPLKRNVLVIGDSLSSDIKGGNNYGVDTCWYNPKKMQNYLKKKPTYEIDTLEQLITLGII